MKFEKQTLARWYRKMLRIRYFEKTVEEKFLAGEIPGFVHLYLGEEAIGVGTCENLNKTDYITSTHRGHGHLIAKGGDLKKAMAEIFGKKTGHCKGKGGSMHIADFSVGMLGANGVVGGGINLATGAGLAAKLNKTDQVAVSFFGDGASNRGTFHEGINMAAAWKLPVIFVVENNQWASTTSVNKFAYSQDVAIRSAGYAIPGVTVQGNDIFAVYKAVGKAVERARNGEGPSIVEAKTFRVGGHFVGDPEKYRTREEVKKQTGLNDPFKVFAMKVKENNWLTNKELEDIENEVKIEIKEALEFAENSEYPDPHEALEDIYV